MCATGQHLLGRPGQETPSTTATHVEVDLSAWRSMRAEASRQGRSLGHEVGRLVVDEVARPTGIPVLLRSNQAEAEGVGRRAKVFARLVVAKPTWNEFRALALGRSVTVARYVGILVEREYAS